MEKIFNKKSNIIILTFLLLFFSYRIFNIYISTTGKWRNATRIYNMRIYKEEIEKYMLDNKYYPSNFDFPENDPLYKRDIFYKIILASHECLLWYRYETKKDNKCYLLSTCLETANGVNWEYDLKWIYKNRYEVWNIECFK